MTNFVSHAPRFPDLEAALKANHAKIDAGTASGAEKAALHTLLDTLGRAPFWAYLIVNGGMNGDWTDYLIHRYRDDPAIAGMEKLFDLPVQNATRQRNERFRATLIQALKPGIAIASVPCGLMRDVLSLPFPAGGAFQLDGYDLDAEALAGARTLAAEYGVAAHCRFEQADAWELGASATASYDVCVSNGLNIYVPEPERRVALYRSFQAMLKPGGTLITSSLTWPPGGPQPSEWAMPNIDLAGLQLTQQIYGMIEPRWSSFCTSEETRTQLQQAGFADIEVIFDAARMMPSFVARKA